MNLFQNDMQIATILKGEQIETSVDLDYFWIHPTALCNISVKTVSRVCEIQ